MGLPDPIQNFIHPTSGGEEVQSAKLAADAARDGVAQSPPVALDATLLPPFLTPLRRELCARPLLPRESA